MGSPFPPRPASVARTAEGTATLGHLDLPAIFIRTTYFNPLTREHTPLPRHQWLLQATRHGSGIRVGWSDEEGVTDLRPLPEDHDPSASWELAWAPLPSEGPPWEWFVDLEKNEWVPLKEVRAIETRKLLRLWPWSSVAKVNAGGFLYSPTERFASTGVIRGNELTRIRLAFGRRASALEVRVDYQLFSRRVAFLFYDLDARKTATVPPGLVLWAFDEGGARVGAGTAIEPDGAVYVLHQLTAEQSKGLHYGFETLAEYMVDLTGTPPSIRLSPPPSSPPNLAQRYLLPERWHSKGWQVRFPTQPAEQGLSEERTWWDSANQGTTATVALLKFHLDDTVLVEWSREDAQIDFPVDITVFNQLLAIRDKRASRPHVSGDPIVDNYLPAEARVVKEGEGLYELTRLFDCDSQLYDLREERRAGAFGQTRPLGVRVAVHDDHRWVDFQYGDPILGTGSFSLHLIDTYVHDYQYPSALTGSNVPCWLHHLVPYSSAYVDQGNATPDDVNEVVKFFDWSADVWNASHPSSVASTTLKRYALAPEGGLQAGQPVVLVRHFFSQRRKQADRRLVIALDVDNVRASTADARIFISPKAAVPAPPIVGDLDQMIGVYSTLAHEIGHSLSLPDEYLEYAKDVPLPIFQQLGFGRSSRFRPFNHDARGMMRSNALPRLRYYWHFVRWLNDVPTFSEALGFLRFVAEDRSFPLCPLVYRLPALAAGVLPQPESRNPWLAIPEVELHPGHALLALFTLGADESAAGGIFSGVGAFVPVVPPADGALVVQIRLAFSGVQALWAVQGLFFQLVGPNLEQVHCFLLDRVASTLARIAVIFEVLYQTVPSPQDPPAHVSVELTFEDSAAPSSLLLPEKDRPPVLVMRPSDVGLAIVRHALGLPSFSPGVDGGPPTLLNGRLTAEEIQSSGLIPAVDAILQEPGGVTRVIQAPVFSRGPGP